MTDITFLKNNVPGLSIHGVFHFPL